MDRRIFLGGLSAGAVAAALANAADNDQQWGDVKGRFVYDHMPPRPRKLMIKKDQEFCKEPLYDESLLVDPESRGMANVVLMLTAKKGDKLPIDASYEEAKRKPAEALIKGCRFQPHVMAIRCGQPLNVRSMDEIGHNPIFYAARNPGSTLLAVGETARHSFDVPEPEPVRVDCSIHPWENAYLVVTDHPYVGISQADGSFTIKNVPIGRRTFQLWHERGRWLVQVKREGQRQNLVDGKLELEIEPGENDLGMIAIERKTLRRRLQR